MKIVRVKSEEIFSAHSVVGIINLTCFWMTKTPQVKNWLKSLDVLYFMTVILDSGIQETRNKFFICILLSRNGPRPKGRKISGKFPTAKLEKHHQKRTKNTELAKNYNFVRGFFYVV